MSRINPIYIFILLFIITVYSFTITSGKQKEFEQNISELFEFKEKAKTFKILNEKWNNKIRVESIIDKIIKNPNFKNANIFKTKNSKGIKLRLNTTEPKIIIKLLNKILNEEFIIKRLDLTSSEIYVEVGLR